MEKREIANKGIVIIGVIILSLLSVPFCLYLCGVITKLVMTLIFIVPVLILLILIVVLKREGRY